MKRLGRLVITEEVFYEILGLPREVDFRYIYYDHERGLYNFVLEGECLPVVPEGGLIPIIDARLTRDDNGAIKIAINQNGYSTVLCTTDWPYNDG